MNTRTKGFVAVIVSAAFFGLVPLFVKTICAGGGNTISAAFYRFLLSLPVIFAYLKIRHIPMKITKKQLVQVMGITLFGYGGTSVLLFTSYNYIPSGMSTTLHFIYPVFTILGCVLFLKEKLRPLKLLCVLLCFGGVVLFYDGESAAGIFGMMLALISGITYAFYTIYLRQSRLQEMDSLKLIFYLNLVAAVMIGIMAGAGGNLTIDMTPKAWLVAFVFASLASFIGVLGFQEGVKYIGPETTVILSTFEPITSVIVGVLVYQESFSLKTLVGCICILASVIIVAKMKEDQDPE